MWKNILKHKDQFEKNSHLIRNLSFGICCLFSDSTEQSWVVAVSTVPGLRRQIAARNEVFVAQNL